MGATKRDILRQFFAESAMLTIVSGSARPELRHGRMCRHGSSALARLCSASIVSWISIVASILTLSLITVTAGVYPAQRAADMTPVESLRHE